MKRVLLTMAWTVGAYFGSGIILGFLAGILFFCMAAVHYDPRPHHTLIAVLSWGVPALVAAAFLVLALRGRLPGTKRQT